MSAAPVLMLFGLACAKQCPELSHLEREVVRVLAEKGFAVKPAPGDAPRPTGETASPEPRDEAKAVEADRVLVLDLEANERILWLTHFVRGVPGAWSIGQVVCAREKEKLQCPELTAVALKGMRPRKAEDVDITAALRFQARLVGQCINADDDAPPEDRVYGRVEMDLSAEPTGEVKVVAIAPAVVSRSTLGRCLRGAMETMNVGPFEGEAIKFRIPIDLD